MGLRGSNGTAGQVAFVSTEFDLTPEVDKGPEYAPDQLS